MVVEPTQLKNMFVKLDHFPNFRGDNLKKLKPPPSFTAIPSRKLTYPLPKLLLSRWFCLFPFGGICNPVLEGTYFIHMNGSPLGPCVFSFLVCRTGQYKHLGWMFPTTRNGTCSKPCSGEYLISYDFNDPQESLYLQGTNVSATLSLNGKWYWYVKCITKVMNVGFRGNHGVVHVLRSFFG